MEQTPLFPVARVFPMVREQQTRQQVQRSTERRKPDAQRLLRLLENPDLQVSGEASSVLREQVANGECVGPLVEHYLSTKSVRALEILTAIREPNDKNLLDKLCDTVKSAPLPTVNLLSEIVHKQPSWLPKLAQHTFFSTFIKCAKQSHSSVVMMVSSLLLLVALLPQAPLLSGSTLHDLFCLFTKASERLQWLTTNRTQEIDHVYICHLELALQRYFQRLYAIFPCNFFSYLRSQFVGSHSADKRQLFEEVLKPLLSQVRFHPSLVFSTKDVELSRERWARRETHDIEADCTQVLLDGGGRSCLPQRPFSSLSAASSSGQWSMLSTPLKPRESTADNSVTFMPIKLPAREAGASCETFWSPSMAVGLHTPPPNSMRDTPVGGLARKESLKESLKSYEPIGFPSDKRPTQSDSRHSSFGQAFSRLFHRSGSAARTIKSDLGPTKSVPPSPMKPEMDQSFQMPRTSQSSANSLIIPVRMDNTRQSPVELKPVLETIHSRQGSMISQADEAEEALENSPARAVALAQLQAVAENLSTLEQTQDDAEIEHLLNNANNYSVSTDLSTAEQENMGNIERQPRREDDAVSGTPSSPEETDEDQPRLVACESVAEFMKKLNKSRFRYYSQCAATESLMPEVSTPINFENVDQDLPPVRKRSASCPQKMRSYRRVDTHKRAPRDGMDLASAPVEPGVTRVLVDDTNVTVDSGHGSRRPTLGAEQTENYLQRFPYLAMLGLGKNEPMPSTVQGEADAWPGGESWAALEQYMQESNEVHDTQKSLASKDRPPLTRCDSSFVLVSKELPLEQQNELLRAQLQLCEQQMKYEHFRRKIQEQRSRRLFGRLKQAKTSEEQLQTQKEKLHVQEMEIQNLIGAITLERTDKFAYRQKLVDKASELNQLEQTKKKEYTELSQAIENTQRELKDFTQQNSTLKTELGEVKQQLFNSKAQAKVAENDWSQVPQLKETVAQLQDRLQSSQQLTRQAGALMPAYTQLTAEKESLIARIATVSDAFKREVSDAKRQLKKERNRAEALSQRGLELESQLHKKMQRTTDLGNLLKGAGGTHEEHLEAVDQKYTALLSVCERQETHIAQLYELLEQRLPPSTAHHSASVCIPKRTGPVEIVSSGSSLGDKWMVSNPNSYMRAKETHDGATN